jgi:hypothetical protein
VINISNCISKDNPPWPTVQLALARPLATAEVMDRARARPRDSRIRIALDWLAGLPRRWGDRWFAMNDAEAEWRGWQVTRVHGGLGRRYRDPRFDTLAECAWCRGAGLLAGMPCVPCLGTGHVTIRGVS